MRTLACRAYATALEGRPGVVHLNFSLREPLVTDEQLPSDPTARAHDAPYVRRSGLRSAPRGDREDSDLLRLRERMREARRGVVVAGSRGA